MNVGDWKWGGREGDEGGWVFGGGEDVGLGRWGERGERGERGRRKMKGSETYWYYPENVGLRRPAIPYQGGRVQDRGDPCILPHAVLGLIHQLAVRVVPAGFSRFACHDAVGPPAAEKAGEDIAKGAGDVGQTYGNGGEIVWRFGEGRLDADVS